jgi:hypothetical protein
MASVTAGSDTFEGVKGGKINLLKGATRLRKVLGGLGFIMLTVVMAFVPIGLPSTNEKLDVSSPDFILFESQASNVAAVFFYMGLVIAAIVAMIFIVRYNPSLIVFASIPIIIGLAVGSALTSPGSSVSGYGESEGKRAALVESWLSEQKGLTLPESAKSSVSDDILSGKPVTYVGPDGKSVEGLFIAEGSNKYSFKYVSDDAN